MAKKSKISELEVIKGVKNTFDIKLNKTTMLKVGLKSVDMSNIIDKKKNSNIYKEIKTSADIFTIDLDQLCEKVKKEYHKIVLAGSKIVDKKTIKKVLVKKPSETFETVLADCEHSYETEVIASIMAQNKQEKNPAWLALIAPPSSGKSYDLRVCGDKEYAKPIDSISDNALAAMRPNMEVELSNDVFSNAEDMTLVFNDMGSMFGDRDDKISKFIGFLTTSFGGSFDRAGPTEVRHYDTKMAVIMGMTDRIYRKNIGKMSSFGNRFLTLKYVNDDSGVFDDDDFKEDKVGKKIQHQIKWAMQQEWKIPFADTLKEEMKSFVKQVVKLRSFFYAKTKYDLERPHRLFNQLKNLMRSHARLCGKDEVDVADFEFVKPLVYLSLPYTQLIYNIGQAGVVGKEYARRYQDALRYGKRLGLFKSTKIKDEWVYESSDAYQDILFDITDYLEGIGYRVDIDGMNVKKKEAKK